MTQIALLSGRVPAAHPGIILHCGDVSLVLEERGARLVVADPPWNYTNTGTVDRGFNGCAAGQYECPSMADIVSVLDRSFDSAATDAYLFCWTTWPMLVDFLAAGGAGRWTYKTGGSWQKTGGLGVGFHVRGDDEPWLLFTKGTPKPYGTLSNAWASPRTVHSEKPLQGRDERQGLIAMVEALTAPGDLVLSVYSGLCPEARACKATGRRCVGAERDPERHATAIGLLAGYRG